jgi:hypothetical protein
MAQNRSPAVMARRVEPHDSLDYFPTPPWAARALCEHLDSWGRIDTATCWEPACGDGHMAATLAETFASVAGSDVHDYGAARQDAVHDFLFPVDPPFAGSWTGGAPDWIITNPPFRLAEAFALRALELAGEGVALLVRTSFLEGIGRHERLFARFPPEWILQFTERVPMVKGRLDGEASTATAYCWIVWCQPCPSGTSRAPRHPTHFPAFRWLPPCRNRLERPEDYPPVAQAEPSAGPDLFDPPADRAG